MTRTGICSLLLSGLLGVGTAAADGLFQDIYRGLDLFATPSGSPIFYGGDGVRSNGARSGRLRIVPDRLGKGWSLELDRSFGADTRGRPETFDLGPFDLQLNGGTTGTFGYTSRFLYIGNASLSANNLQYTLRAKSGAQDAELRGTFNLQSALEINQFGFYETVLAFQHAGSELELDGVLARDSEEMNFDIGPIVVEGNVFYDMILATLTTLGVDTNALEQLTPKSPIAEINDAIEESFRQHALVAGYRLEADANGEYILTPTDATASLSTTLAGRGEVTGPVGPGDPGRNIIPEPGTLVLIALGASAYWAVRRRRA
jgi:hypothetical protein